MSLSRGGIPGAERFEGLRERTEENLLGGDEKKVTGNLGLGRWRMPAGRGGPEIPVWETGSPEQAGSVSPGFK